MNFDEQDSASGKAAELAAFSAIVSALSPLRQRDRLRLFKSIATFFDLPVDNDAVTQHGTARHSSGQHADSPISQRDAPTIAPAGFSEDRAPTPKFFLLEKKPQTDVERIACLAYYLAHYRQQSEFKTLDLSKLNTEAAQIKFTNAAKAVDNATQAHFLIQAGQGKKQISAIGELYVQALPDRAAARLAATEVRKRRAKTKSRTVSSKSPGEPPREFISEGEADSGDINGSN